MYKRQCNDAVTKDWIKNGAWTIEVASEAEAHLGAQADRLAASMQNGVAATIEEGDREVLEMRAHEIFDLLSNFLASGKT